MGDYISYLSAIPVRIFFNDAQWKWPRSRSKLHKVNKYLSQNMFVWGKWDILDPKITCTSGSAPHLPQNPTSLLKNSEGSIKNSQQKNWKKLWRNYNPNWKNCWKKTLKSFFFFLPVVSFHVFQHNEAFPITWCLLSSVPIVPHCPPFLRCLPYEAVSQDLGDILLKIPSTSDNLRKNH